MEKLSLSQMNAQKTSETLNKENLIVFPNSSPIKGNIKIIGDKSISHRAIIISSIANGESNISGFLNSKDNLSTINAFRSMGVSIEILNAHNVRVRGVGLRGLKGSFKQLDMGNSGTAMRLLCGLLSAQSFTSTLIGDESLSKRPMDRIINPLTDMGASIGSNDGKAPLTISPAQLKAIEYELPIASAQVKSSILLASIYTKGKTTLIEKIPTRDHTEVMLKKFGSDITKTIDDKNRTVISIQQQEELEAQDIQIPGDISAAAFFIVSACITPGSEILIQDIGINPLRTGIINILLKMGADIELINQRSWSGEQVADIKVKYRQLEGINITPDMVPSAIDEFPIIFVAAAFAKGKTIIDGIEELKTKESNRIDTMVENLNALGVDIYSTHTGVVIEGILQNYNADIDFTPKATLIPTTYKLNSYGDHRIAMALTIALQHSNAPVIIEDTANIKTSFPNFIEKAKSMDLNVDMFYEQVSNIITIDGHSGAGKGELAKRLARALGWNYLDSGSIYRALALFLIKNNYHDLKEEQIVAVSKNFNYNSIISKDNKVIILIDGEDISQEIRNEKCAEMASKIASMPKVREMLIDTQKTFARLPGLVTDGRDMGSTIFPEARYKLFLSASVDVRANRRHKELLEKNIEKSLDSIKKAIVKRDALDETRESSPLVCPEDAIKIDNSELSIEQTFDKAIIELGF